MTTEEALKNVVFVGIEETNTGFQNACYFFIEDLLTKMASKGLLDDMLKRNHKRWT